VNIWIDLANSPQVLFFRPLIGELERRGHAVTITSRDFAQTIQLSDRCGLQHTPIGGHGGKRLGRIGLSIVDRAWQLLRFARGRRFDLAVSHNSYAQALAAAALSLPFVTLMDYEHQPANHLCFRLARRVLVPEYFPGDALRRYGAPRRGTACYHGLKEQVYLSDFAPQAGFLESLGLPAERVIAVVRPPASWTLYHHFENPLFDRAFDHVASDPRALVVFLPRIAAQGESVRARGLANVWVPPQAVDGPNLLYAADLVVGGGGTMNREAAVLGTPVYSLFAGQPAAVDDYLVRQGRMRRVVAEPDVPAIRIEKQAGREPLAGGSLVREITELILAQN
jgi:predicted glycosyltransferase